MFSHCCSVAGRGGVWFTLLFELLKLKSTRVSYSDKTHLSALIYFSSLQKLLVFSAVVLSSIPKYAVARYVFEAHIVPVMNYAENSLF